jgi:hypothetical protein
MIRTMPLLALCLLLPACASERRVVVDNSPNAKFAALFGGTTVTSDGSTAPSSGMWQVQQPQAPGANKPVSEGARRIAELLRAQAANPNAPRPTLSDPGTNSGWQITTSFQNADDTHANTPPPPLNPPTDPLAAPLNTAAPGIPATAIPPNPR